MKLFKRKDKDSISIQPPKKSKVRKHPGTNSMLLTGIVLCLLSIGAAGALAGLTFIHNSQQQQQQQAEQLTAGALAALNHILGQIDADTARIAANQELARLLLDDEPQQLALLEQHLRQRGQVVDVYISSRGKASVQSERPAPVNYAALELIASAESGANPPVEFVTTGGRNYLYKAAPIKLQDSVLGTVLVVYQADIVSNALPTAAADTRLSLLQKLPNAPELQIASSGQSSAGTSKTIRTSHPNWQLQLQQQEFQPMELAGIEMLLAAVAIALGGSLLALFLLNQGMGRRIAKDCNLFSQLLQNWQMGTAMNAEKIRTPELQALAASLAQTAPKRTAGTGEVKTKPATLHESNDILALKKGQVMEVEEVDSFLSGEEIEEAEIAHEEHELNHILDLDILDEQEDPFGLGSEDPRERSRQQVDPGIFRAYDIRGVAGDSLSEDTAYWVGRAVAAHSIEQSQNSVIVGRDGRLSSPQLCQALIEGLLDGGCQVTNLGVVPTPVVYFATHSLEANSAVMVTGSHNPPEYNGFKIVIAGQTLAGDDVTALYQRIVDNQLSQGSGSEHQLDILPAYLERISGDIAIARPMKVVLDCGNGAAGVIAPQLFEALGCTVVSLNAEVDGNFPAHHPDPGNPDNLQQLIESVTTHQADIGIAFDGDADRLGVVTSAGTIIYPDRLMMLLAKDMVSRNPGADIIFDVKCSRRLASLISGYGGRPVMWKTGHSLMKAKLQQTGALLAGELSGHIFYNERWYGFDDGMYAAARMLEIIALDDRSSEQIFAAFPASKSTPELQLRVTDEIKFKIIAALKQKGEWADGKITDLDGVRVDFHKSWGLIRASNTTPSLVLRFEGDSDEDLQEVMQLFRQQLQKLVPNLPWPF